MFFCSTTECKKRRLATPFHPMGNKLCGSDRLMFTDQQHLELEHSLCFYKQRTAPPVVLWEVLQTHLGQPVGRINQNACNMKNRFYVLLAKDIKYETHLGKIREF